MRLKRGFTTESYPPSINMMHSEFMEPGIFVMRTSHRGELDDKFDRSFATVGREELDYNIFALKYAGPFTSSVAMVLYRTDWDKKIERNYYIWVVQGGGITVVLDCGVRPFLAAKRKLHRYLSPDKILKRFGWFDFRTCTAMKTSM